MNPFGTLSGSLHHYAFPLWYCGVDIPPEEKGREMHYLDWRKTCDRVWLRMPGVCVIALICTLVFASRRRSPNYSLQLS